MKTIKEINKEMKDIMERYPSPDTTPRELLGYVAIEGNKLKVLKEQTKAIMRLIEKKIYVYKNNSGDNEYSEKEVAEILYELRSEIKG